MNRLILAALALGAAIPTAHSHAVFSEADATAGRSFVARLGVPHGCEGRATEVVHIRLPEGFIGAKPMPKAGWTLEIIEGDYAQTYELHGRSVSRGPVEIRWSGGSLEDAWYDEFAVRGTFDAGLAGTEAPFAATQLCGEGQSVSWDEVAAEGVDPHSLDHPAPTVRVSAAGGEGHGAHDHGAAASGPIEASGGFARAMLPNAPSGGGYVTLRNTGETADRLVSVSSPAAGTVEIHEMEMEGDVMRMRALPQGIAIEPGQTVELAPGGLHLMFLDVAAPFKEGDTVPVTLTFETAGPVETTLSVGAPNAAGAEGAHAHH